jgi:selT/selW/selH-like putative selenoprotein
VVTPGGRGQFDVIANGQLVFSKQAEGRFPDHDEILALLAS